MLRSILSTLAGCAAVFGAWHHLRPSDAPEAEAAAGRYVEARTASVFAGACHYNGELVTAGREALLAWRFERGVEAGVELAGLEAVALVRADQNLALTEARRSVLYVPSRLDTRERAALLAAVERHAGDALGERVEVRAAELAVRVDAQAYRVEVAGVAELTGSLDADRACCRMPQNVWYEPLAPLEARVVGRSETFEVHEAALALDFVRHDANDSFVGGFDGAPPKPAERRPAWVAAR